MMSVWRFGLTKMPENFSENILMVLFLYMLYLLKLESKKTADKILYSKVF